VPRDDEHSHASRVDKPTRVHAVWMDFGGVLTPPAPVLVSAFCDRSGVTPEMLVTATWAVAKTYGTDDPMEPLEVPLVNERDWGAQVERELWDRFGVRGDLSDFGARWLEGHRANADWMGYLPSLRKRGYFVGMLSNMMPSFEPHWRSIAPPGELFDDVVLSFEVGTRKPRSEIFELATERADVSPERCLLVDDLELNCTAAQAAGWLALHCTDAPQAIEQLKSLLEPAGVITKDDGLVITSPSRRPENR
jgi:putative hydrolase of the HAD superfamily